MTSVVTTLEKQAACGFRNGLTTYTIQFKPPPIEGRIFKDKGVFSEDYVPERIPCRENQLRENWSNLNNADKGWKPDNMVEMGGLGTGKTVLIRHMCRALPSGCVALYVNCSRENTRTRLIMSGLQQLGIEAVSGFDSLHYVALFEKAVKNYKFVGLILDEANEFFTRKDSEHFEFFYWVSRLLSNLFVIMLTNRTDFQMMLRKTLDPRILDTFRWRTIVFPDYGCDELLTILWDRFQAGFKPGAYDENKTEAAHIVKYVYDRDGGAREAIALARRIGEAAESRDHDRIEPSDIDEGQRLYERSKELDLIRSLPKVERTIISHVLKRDTTSDEAYSWFKDTAQEDGEPSGYRIYHDALAKLELKGLMQKQKQPRGRGRGSIPMRISVPPEMRQLIQEVMQEQTPPPQNAISNDQTGDTP